MWPFGDRRRRATLAPENPPRPRLVQIDGEITDGVANTVVAKLLFLNSEGTREPITLRINSPGGSFAAGMGVVDTLRFVGVTVNTEAPNVAHGMAAVILACGTGSRRVGPAAELSLGPLEAMRSGSVSDLARAQHQLVELVAELCRQPLAKVAHDLSAWQPFSATEAVAYGLADHVGGCGDESEPGP